jgi:NAD(P)H-dependent flavin oxidoreductase YrpB (nitropropane dioxygenase family)
MRRDNEGVGALLQPLGTDLPIVQASMGGGLAGHQLAAAVSAAGGLGTIGFLAPEDLRSEIAAARRLSDRPLAVNLLLPFARRGHFKAASEADVVVTFWGSPKRQTSKIWIHQCGSVEEALAAREAGADTVIAQGVEAGGHVRGTVPAMQLLARVRGAAPDDYPVLLAGGIADASDVRARLDAPDAGADAAPPGGDAEAEPADVRSRRRDRRRPAEPDRRRTALRGGMHRPHHRHPPSGRARPRAGPLGESSASRPKF